MNVKQRQAGVVYLSAVMVIMLMAGLIMSYVAIALRDSQSVAFARDHEQSFQIAESGLDLALAELQAEVDLGADGIGQVSGQLSGGQFEATVEPTFAGSGRYTVRAVGSRGAVRETLEAVVDVGEETAPPGLVVASSFSAPQGLFTDSFESGAGSYESQVLSISETTGASYAKSGGNILSNGCLELGEGSQIHGTCTAGPGYTVTGSEGQTTGGTISASAPTEIPPVIYAPPVASSGPFVHEGGSLTLGSGTYRYDSFHATAPLTLSGEVTLYVDGPFTLELQGGIELSPGACVRIIHDAGNVELGGQGFVNVGSNPAALTFESAGSMIPTKKKKAKKNSNTLNNMSSTEELSSRSLFSLTSQTPFFGTLRAPASDLHLGEGCEVFGRITAHAAIVEGFMRFHADESFGSCEHGAKLHLVILRRAISSGS